MANDYFADLRADAPVERELKYRDRTRKVHFRRITAGERTQLLQGQSVQIGGDAAKSRSVDLADMTTRRHQLVQFMLVRPDGTNVYATLADVQAEPDDLIDALAALADTAFDEDDAGNG